MPRITSAFSGSVLPGCLVVLAAVGAMAAAPASDTAPPAGRAKGPTLRAPAAEAPRSEAPAAQGPVEPSREAAATGPGDSVDKPGGKETGENPDGPTAPATPKAGETPAQGPAEKPVQKPEAAEPPKPPTPLSPEMVALRDSVRRTLATVYRQPPSTRDSTVTDILDLCLAYGCKAEVRGPSNEKLNAITCLCWNYPCAGRQPLVIADGHIAARFGYGLQTRRSQMLAVLAQARVPTDYPVRVGDDVRKVADMVEYEKLACRADTDASLTLIALAYYLEGEPTWKNALGEEWSIGRLVQQELARPVAGEPDGGTGRLMGLSYAVQTRVARNLPLEGPLLKAEEFVRQYHDFALKCQNADGSWHPDVFVSVGTSNDTPGVLRATGHVLEWLAFSLPDQRLEDPRVVRAVARVNSLLGSQRYLGGIGSLSPRETESVMHALHALALYDQRVFAPRDAQRPHEPKDAAATPAQE